MENTHNTVNAPLTVCPCACASDLADLRAEFAARVGVSQLHSPAAADAIVRLSAPHESVQTLQANRGQQGSKQTEQINELISAARALFLLRARLPPP